MNKTIAVIVLAGIVLFGIAGAVIIVLLRPDASATFFAFIGTTLSFMLLAIGSIYALGKLNDKVDVVSKQTNGINTALLAKATDHSEDTITRMKGGE